MSAFLLAVFGRQGLSVGGRLEVKIEHACACAQALQEKRKRLCVRWTCFHTHGKNFKDKSFKKEAKSQLKLGQRFLQHIEIETKRKSGKMECSHRKGLRHQGSGDVYSLTCSVLLLTLKYGKISVGKETAISCLASSSCRTPSLYSEILFSY